MSATSQASSFESERERIEAVLSDAVDNVLRVSPPADDFVRAIGERLISSAKVSGGGKIGDELRRLLQARRDGMAWTEELLAAQASVRSQVAQIRQFCSSSGENLPQWVLEISALDIEDRALEIASVGLKTQSDAAREVQTEVRTGKSLSQADRLCLTIKGKLKYC